MWGESVPPLLPSLYSNNSVLLFFFFSKACPTGNRILNGSSECVQCGEEAELRDYLFLGFYCVVAVAVRLSLLSLLNIGRNSKKSAFTKL